MSDSRRSSFDDLNWGRLNLVSAQDQVAGQHTWKVTYPLGDRLVRVTCRALPESGVPHGVDNDVSSALIDHYMSIGLPEDGEMTLAYSELMRLAGFHRSGKYREMLAVSLDRLHTTSYEIAGGWRDHPNRRWTTAKFHFIELLEYTHQGEAGKFDERSVLRLRLAQPLVASLRSGYTKPLNMEFMQSLSRPRTRIIFRLLDAMRYNPENPDELVDQYDVGLTELADQCKLPNTRPDSVRRSLAAPHEELLKKGYLRNVTYSGRGRAQRLHYEFSPDFTPVSPALLHRLRLHGVADGVSRQLTREFTTSVLLARIEQFERLVASGQLRIRKTAAHALVHLIRHSDQYVADHHGEGGRGQSNTQAQKADQKPAAQKVTAPTEPTDGAAPDWAAQFAGMNAEEVGNFIVKRLSLLYSRKFTVAELDGLRQLLQQGQLDPVKLIEEAYQRLATLDAQGFVDDLKGFLRAKESGPLPLAPS